jgi:hypothetical protein
MRETRQEKYEENSCLMDLTDRRFFEMTCFINEKNAPETNTSPIFKNATLR